MNSFRVLFCTVFLAVSAAPGMAATCSPTQGASGALTGAPGLSRLTVWVETLAPGTCGSPHPLDLVVQVAIDHEARTSLGVLSVFARTQFTTDLVATYGVTVRNPGLFPFGPGAHDLVSFRAPQRLLSYGFDAPVFIGGTDLALFPDGFQFGTFVVEEGDPTVFEHRRGHRFVPYFRDRCGPGGGNLCNYDFDYALPSNANGASAWLYNSAIAPVPLPAPLALMGAALMPLTLLARRRRRGAHGSHTGI